MRNCRLIYYLALLALMGNPAGCDQKKQLRRLLFPMCGVHKDSTFHRHRGVVAIHIRCMLFFFSLHKHLLREILRKKCNHFCIPNASSSSILTFTFLPRMAMRDQASLQSQGTERDRECELQEMSHTGEEAEQQTPPVTSSPLTDSSIPHIRPPPTHPSTHPPPPHTHFRTLPQPLTFRNIVWSIDQSTHVSISVYMYLYIYLLIFLPPSLPTQGGLHLTANLCLEEKIKRHQYFFDVLHGKGKKKDKPCTLR